jgi:hypothetical protein
MQGEVSNQLDWPETLTIKPPSNSAWPKTTGDVQVRYRCGWFRECDLVDYMARQRVCALFVMSRERPVLVRSSSDAKCQEYLQNDRHGVASITKSIVSVVFGLVALNPAYGAPLDLDTSVAKVLARSGLTYPKSGVSIRQLLQMSSGMGWSDSETETALRITANVDGSQVGPHRTLREAVQARLSTAEFSATPEFNYSGFDTQLLGLLIEDRLGKSGVWPRPTLDQAVESLIWRKTGAVKEANWKADFMFHPPAYCCFTPQQVTSRSSAIGSCSSIAAESAGWRIGFGGQSQIESRPASRAISTVALAHLSTVTSGGFRQVIERDSQGLARVVSTYICSPNKT